MSNDLISNYSSLEDLGSLLVNNEDEEGNPIFTLSADLELVNLKAVKGEFEKIKTGNIEVAGIKIGEESSGKGVIEVGENMVVIETAMAGEEVNIHLTVTSKLNGKNLYIDEIIEGESFAVKIEEGEAVEKIEFNWLIIE
jgi:hypothetical protein